MDPLEEPGGGPALALGIGEVAVQPLQISIFRIYYC